MGTLMFPAVCLAVVEAVPRAEDGQAMLRHRLESRRLESRAWIRSYPARPVTSLWHSGVRGFLPGQPWHTHLSLASNFT